MSIIETVELWTVAETAEFLKVGKPTVYRLIAAGEIPGHRIGGSLRIDRGELLESLALRPIRVEEDTP